MLYGDFHIHTNYSGDGKQSVADIITAAKAKGLRQLGFTDHGFRHLAYGTNVKKMDKLAQELQLARKNTDIELLLGIEANVYSLDGDVDLTEEQRHNLDFVVAGFHKTMLPKSLKDAFTYTLPALFGKKRFSKSQIERFTKAFVTAIKSGKFDILAHLNYCIPTFVEEIGKAAVDYNVLIELNGKRISLTDEEITKLYSLGARFVLNSDAHTQNRVGEVDNPLSTAERLKIMSAVVNVDNRVVFRENGTTDFFTKRKAGNN